MAEISSASWSETDASNTAPPPDGWPEGMNPSEVNNAARMMMGAVKRFWDRINPVLTAGGGTTAYTLTPTVALAAYALEIWSWKMPSANAVDATMNISGLGARNIRKLTTAGYVNVAAGDMPLGSYAMAVYNTTDSKLDLLSVSSGADFNINGLTTETGPSSSDLIPIYDVSATANRKMSLADMFKAINGLNVEATVDPANDFIPLYDASGGTTDKSTPTAILNGTLTTQGDLMVRDGTSATRLAAGTAGYGLVAGGASANLAWANNQVRAHAAFTGTGAPAFRGTPYNVTSITDNGTGNWTMNFTAALPSANYTVLVSSDVSSGNSMTVMNFSAPGTTTLVLQAVAMNSGSATLFSADPGIVCFAAMGG